MDTPQKIAWLLLLAVNVMTVVNQVVYPGWYELAFWIALALAAFLFRRAYISPGRRLLESTLLYVLLFLGAYLILWWGSGYFSGFGSSPYLRTAAGILKNAVLFGGIIAAQEWVRAYALSCGSGSRRMAVFAAWTFFAYGLNSAYVRDAFANWSAFFSFLGGMLLPAVCAAVFLTWLSRSAGFLPPLLWRLLPEAAQWLLPAFPKSDWQTNMLINAAFPIFALLILERLEPGLHRRSGKRKRRRSKPAAWAGLAAFMGLTFAFFLGLMPLRPMVIATGSMLPAIRPGDMVILANADAAALKEGDVIAYQLEGLQIVHRVVQVVSDGEGISFVLKGDNNELQ